MLGVYIGMDRFLKKLSHDNLSTTGHALILFVV